MGAITEILDTLGYGEQPGESTARMSTISNIEERSSQNSVETPTSSAVNGGCVGCELSARYF